MGQWELLSNESSHEMGPDFDKNVGKAMFQMAVNNKSIAKNQGVKPNIEIFGTFHADEISPSQVEIAMKLTPAMLYIINKQEG